MRQLRRERASVGQVRALAWLGLLGTALALAGCASFAADNPYASGSRITDERADLGDDRSPVQLALSALFSGSYSPGPMRSGRLSRAEEEAVIARAIAEHEMRKP